MDGRQGDVSPSLQHNLNRWIISATALFALIGTLLSGWIAFTEAQELQDDLLRQIATLGLTPNDNLILPGDKSEPEETVILQRLGDSHGRALAIPATTKDGLQTLTIDGVSWRVLIYRQPGADNTARFAISQQTEVRDELAWQSTLRTLLPLLLLAPVLLLAVRFAVKRSLTPLRTLATIVDQRNESSLETLTPQRVPQEILPFINSINRLLSRVRNAVAQQQRFVADAAHELRTPVTALSLLADNLANATTLEQAQARLTPLQEGLVRMRSLVNQLLDLARLQGENTAQPLPIDLRHLVQDVIAELYPLAEAKTIDLGMTRNEALTVMDISGNLRMLIRNAVENAIRYTPKGGRVDISLFAEEGQAVLQVEDNGSGIPEEALELVFEPFYRGESNSEPGNGLGLAISQEIAQRLGGVISLSNRPQGGLVFCYRQQISRGDE